MVGILAAVPWGTIIDAAPKIIEGASKLLSQIGLTRQKIPSTDAAVLVSSGEIDPDGLTTTVKALEASLTRLNTQMRDAAKLIGELAEANRLLAARVYNHRQWLRLLAAVCMIAIGLATYSLISR